MVLIDLEKVRIMTKLAVFEQEEEEDAIKITRYYQGDYVRHELLKTLVCITFGYVCLCVLGVLYQLEYLIGNAIKLDYSKLLVELIGGYCILLILYGIGVSLGYIYQYHRAKKKIKGYDKNLHVLRKLYRKEKEREK